MGSGREWWVGFMFFAALVTMVFVTDNAKDFILPNAQVEIVVHDRLTELGLQPFDFDDVLLETVKNGQKSISKKNMAKNASMTITRNSDCTTESVVR